MRFLEAFLLEVYIYTKKALRLDFDILIHLNLNAQFEIQHIILRINLNFVGELYEICAIDRFVKKKQYTLFRKPILTLP